MVVLLPTTEAKLRSIPSVQSVRLSAALQTHLRVLPPALRCLLRPMLYYCCFVTYAIECRKRSTLFAMWRLWAPPTRRRLRCGRHTSADAQHSTRAINRTAPCAATRRHRICSALRLRHRSAPRARARTLSCSLSLSLRLSYRAHRTPGARQRPVHSDFCPSAARLSPRRRTRRPTAARRHGRRLTTADEPRRNETTRCHEQSYTLAHALHTCGITQVQITLLCVHPCCLSLSLSLSLPSRLVLNLSHFGCITSQCTYIRS